MNRRELILALLALGAGAPCPRALAQGTSVRPWRIGLLTNNPRAPSGECYRAPKAFSVAGHLERHGLIEGQHFAIEARCADGRPERLLELALELVASKVDVVVTAYGEPLLAARSATDKIPIVMLMGPDPVAHGWARSHGRPGGNLTGFTWELDESDSIGLKGYELIREMIPNARRIVHLERANHPLLLPYNIVRKKASERLGVEIIVVGIPSAEGIEETFRQIRSMKADALSINPDAFVLAHAPTIMREVVRASLPTQIWGDQWTINLFHGALFSFGANTEDQPRRAAEYVAKILKGAQPGDLPIVRPSKTDLTINLRVARALGIKIPQSVLIRADRVID